MNEQKVPDTPLAVLQLFRVVFRAAQQHSSEIEKKLGISGAQAWLLAELQEAGSLKAGELAARMSIKPATLSNMLIRLVEQGYISRNRSEHDLRVVEVALTAAGRELMAGVGAAPKGWLPEALSRLSGEQLAELAGGLATLLQVMGVEDAAAANSPLPFTE